MAGGVFPQGWSGTRVCQRETHSTSAAPNPENSAVMPAASGNGTTDFLPLWTHTSGGLGNSVPGILCRFRAAREAPPTSASIPPRRLPLSMSTPPQPCEACSACRPQGRRQRLEERTRNRLGSRHRRTTTGRERRSIRISAGKRRRATTRPARVEH